MEDPKIRWCREVVEQIRFKPDRDKVWDELMAHIEDRLELLMESGLTKDEAEVRAVTAMGDPVETGKQLDAVHKPWLGWLWRLSRWLVMAMLFGTLLFTILYWSDVAEYFDGRFLWMKSESAVDELLEGDRADKILDLNASGVLEDYTFCVDKAAWGSGGVLRLRCKVSYPWYRPKLSIRAIERFYFVDEQGNRWINHGEDGIDPGEYWVWNYSRDDWFSWSAKIGVSGVPEETEWLDLCYDYAGRKMTIRIDLTGGGES